MRIDLTDLDRLEGIVAALERLFWCLTVVAFFAAILGSAGTGLLVLILGAASFVVRAGLEDFSRARREPAGSIAPEAVAVAADPGEEPDITIYPAKGTRHTRQRSKSAV